MTKKIENIKKLQKIHGTYKSKMEILELKCTVTEIKN